MSKDKQLHDYPDFHVCACANLRRATRLVTQAYDAALRPAGVRATQFTMLAVLVSHSPIRQSEFAEILGMDGTTLTRNLQPLLKMGWIRIDRDEDQRVRVIEITEMGQHVLDEATPLWQEAQSQFVKRLGKTQWSGFLEALKTTADLAKRE